MLRENRRRAKFGATRVMRLKPEHMAGHVPAV
jgi:hypothetical protein